MTLPCDHDESRLSTITVKGRKPYQRCRECHRLAEARRRHHHRLGRIRGVLREGLA